MIHVPWRRGLETTDAAQKSVLEVYMYVYIYIYSVEGACHRPRLWTHDVHCSARRRQRGDRGDAAQLCELNMCLEFEVNPEPSRKINSREQQQQQRQQQHSKQLSAAAADSWFNQRA